VVQYTTQPPANAALTGVPTAPTATPLTNNTQIATTAYADASAFADFSTEQTRALAAEALLAPKASTPTVLTPAFANGTAAQLADLTADYMVYLEITTAGTAFSLAIGPVNTTVNTIIASSTATLGSLITIRLPAGWWLKWAGTTAAIATQTAVRCN
jgi:hypothetical protein